MAMLMSTNAMKSSNSNMDLASLLTLNTASAECEDESVLYDCLRNPGYVCIFMNPTDPDLDCETPEGWAWWA